MHTKFDTIDRPLQNPCWEDEMDVSITGCNLLAMALSKTLKKLDSKVIGQ